MSFMFYENVAMNICGRLAMAALDSAVLLKNTTPAPAGQCKHDIVNTTSVPLKTYF